MMKHKWLIWLTCALLLLSGWTYNASVSLAAVTGSSLTVEQDDDHLIISGESEQADPDLIPLIVKDSLGQLLYFQDVAGAGQPFQVEFQIPAWAATGTAEATLYSTVVATERFTIKDGQTGGNKKMNVSIRIVGDDGEEILKKKTFSLSKRSSVFDLLKVAAEDNGLDYEVRDPDQDGEQVYLVSIDGLAEFDQGPGSGWVYKVNKEGPQTSIDRYELSNGDNVEFLYTTDLGESQDVGSDKSGVSSSYQASVSADVSSAIVRLDAAESVKDIVEIARGLFWDLADYEIAKQQTMIPDVSLFLQAAYERAGMLEERKSIVSNPLEPDVQEVSSLEVKDSLDQQAELKDELEELLESSNLYKSLLGKLKPVILVPFPTKTESNIMKVFVEPNARERLLEAGATLAMAKGSLKAELTLNPAFTTNNTLWVMVRTYDDQEQTKQFDEWQSTTNTEPVPLTRSYRVESSEANAVKINLQVPVTGSIDDSNWPVLYQRTQADAKWSPVVSLISITKSKASVSVKAGADLVVAAVSHSFEDVLQSGESSTQWKEAIAALFGWGVVQGKTPTDFGSNQPVSRAEFYALLTRIEEGNIAPVAQKQGATPQFSDVPQGSWFAPIVQTAVEQGWTTGRSQNKFAPQATMTRSEVAVLLTRLFEQKMGQQAEATPLVNVRDVQQTPAWASHGMNVATANQWLIPDQQGNILPLTSITRKDAAYAIYRYYVAKYTSNDK